MKNILKAKIGFQSGTKAGIIGSVTFTFIFALTYFIDVGISFTSLTFELIEFFSLLLSVSIFGAVIGGLFGTLISLTVKTPRFAVTIGVVIGIIAGSLYPILLLVIDGVQLRYLLILFIGLTTGAFAGRYGGLDFRSKWAKNKDMNQAYNL